MEGGMKSILLGGIGALIFSTAAIAAPATGPGQAKDLVIGFYASDADVGAPTPAGDVDDNLGMALAGGFFGNTSNSGNNLEDAPDRGHGVRPSSSPGPATIGGGFGTLGENIVCLSGNEGCRLAP
jgi:hypothetical protein